jgi:hypothetical protein
MKRTTEVDTNEYEYLVVADKTSEILLSTTNKAEAVNLVSFIRRGGGEVTVFVSLGV